MPLGPATVKKSQKDQHDSRESLSVAADALEL